LLIPKIEAHGMKAATAMTRIAIADTR
ncbi:MAG: hypothetical protein QOH37_3908, partial [Nocardioidaceae bacterium]|nr:hypothetical protein [Nocardioidaceae bacterium]